jgi:hypothetical protein
MMRFQEGGLVRDKSAWSCGVSVNSKDNEDTTIVEVGGQGRKGGVVKLGKTPDKKVADADGIFVAHRRQKLFLLVTILILSLCQIAGQAKHG